MGIIWGLTAALFWGVADFVSREASQRVGVYRGVLYAHLVSFVALSVVLLVRPLVVSWSPQTIALAFVLGCSNTGGALLLYYGLAKGQISVVSPIGASFAAVTLALSLLGGAELSTAKIGALVLTLAGVILAATPPPQSSVVANPREQRRAIWASLVAALLFGTTFWGLGFVTDDLGPFLPVWLGRVASMLLLPLLALPLRQKLGRPPRHAWPALLTVGLVDSGANVAYNAGLLSDKTGAVAVLGALFSPVTVLLALVFLHERLTAWQWLGVAMICGGVGWVSAK